MTTAPHGEVKAWARQIARIGYAAKGVVYVAIGVFSAQAGLHGGSATDSRQVIQTIAHRPFGQVLMAILAAGLVCYVIWRLLAAFADAAAKGSDAKGLLLRSSFLISAIVYSGIAVAAAKTVMGTASGGGSDSEAQSWTARLMAQPLGTWLAVFVGSGIVGYGLFQCYRAYSGSFTRSLSFTGFGARHDKVLLRVCKIGLAARGVVFCIAGIFLMLAGLRADPGQARGLTGALNAVAQQPYGAVLFEIVALGLSAYGVYCCVKAVYGKITAHRQFPIRAQFGAA